MRAVAACPATARTASGAPPSSPIGVAAKTPTSSVGCGRWIAGASAASGPASLISAHPDEYKRLLEAEQRRRRQALEAGSGGGPDAA